MAFTTDKAVAQREYIKCMNREPLGKLGTTKVSL